MKKSILLALASLLVLIIWIILSQVEIEVKVNSAGKILPIRELHLIRPQDDKITMIVKDNLLGQEH